jgi:hypothetical protein
MLKLVLCVAACAAILLGYLLPAVPHAIVGSLIGRLVFVFGAFLVGLQDFEVSALMFIVLLAFIAINRRYVLTDPAFKNTVDQVARFEDSLEAETVRNPPIDGAALVPEYPPLMDYGAVKV